MKNILIVDDEEEILEVIECDLEIGGILDVAHIHKAMNGLEALEIVRNKPIDVVLSDINMPQMNGIEFVKKIKEEGFDRPILFLSGHGDPETIKTVEGLTIFKFLSKPFREKDLVSAIFEALNAK